MSEAPAADAITLSQQTLGKCILLEQEVQKLEARTDGLKQRIETLEGDLDE